MSFDELFRTTNATRDKFLSRVFGIFSEEIVRYWARESDSYEDLGRPVLKAPDDNRGYTLDFTFRSKTSQQIFIAEMKCELQYRNHRYMVLETPDQLDHHKKKQAFKYFLEMAKNPNSYQVTVKQESQQIDGAILVWGSYTQGGYEKTKEHYGFADILSVERIISDLVSSENQEFANFIQNYESWCTELFDGLSNMSIDSDK